MASMTRDRRSPLFGASTSQPEARIDPESLERENDRDIDALAEKTSFLRQMTHNIKSEVNSQNRVLDNLGSSMTGVQVGLGTTVTRFKRVFEDPKRKRTLYIIIGTVAGLFLLYLLAQHARHQ